ncbi:hypothetical protein HPP92_010087 [Vanilla planifolia]|uniref:Pentatricopeptide repeat-containing protein n=1 Tax=Vanilla planifolia TaxID=51239 RepID=A0A835UX76_VANPL|nr:hypothetical protein HPP92_010087 [Vanilla planifolia]
MPSCRFFSHIPTPVKWRRAIAQRNLAVQISSLLIHHKNGISILRSRTSLLPRPLPSSLLRRILKQTHSNPDVSFRFFLFARAHLSFNPDLVDFSTIAAILVAGDQFSSVAHLLYPVLRSHPAPALLDSLFYSSNYFFHSSATTVLSKLLNFVLEIYSTLPSLCGAIETFKRIKDFQVVPSKRSCNALLDLLCSSGEFRIAWLVYASAVRIGAMMDGGSWTTLARLLCKEGKLHKAEMLLNSGFCRRASCYDLVIKCYARKRHFSLAIRVLNGMEERGFRTRLSTLSSILDESCRFGDFSLAGLMIKEMIVGGLLPVFPSLDFDWIVRRFCELGKTFAAMLIFEKAQRRNLELMSACTCVSSGH